MPESPRPPVLTAAQREAALAGLPGWRHDPDRDALVRQFRFADFSAAFGWMTRVAMEAERLDHHPEWTNVWNRVDVVLTTHQPRGLTGLDIALARAMDRLAG